MLSKELKDLEVNELVNREVQDTRPVTVEYSITDYGMTLEDVIVEISQWGKSIETELWLVRNCVIINPLGYFSRITTLSVGYLER